jgi:cytochrome oxidase assembly protein ShyY1
LKKWLNWVTLVVVFSVACGFLANWQLDRRETKLASIGLITANYNQAPVPISDLAGSNNFNSKANLWRSVSMTGNYLVKSELLVRNRPNNGQPGFEQLVPFRSDLGLTFFVSRGWLPTGQKQDSPDQVPIPTSESVTITARILAGEQVLDRSAPSGQIASINVDLAQKISGVQSSARVYLRLINEDGSKPTGLTPMPVPSVEEGNNLSYAVQWVVFALMAAFALIWRIRRDTAIEAGTLKVRQKRQSDLDADAEDDITKVK